MTTMIVRGMVRPSVLSSVERIVKSLRVYLCGESAVFSAIAGECVTNGEVMKAHAVVVLLLVLIGIGGAL